MWRVSISVSLILSRYIFQVLMRKANWYREGETVDGSLGGAGGSWVMMVTSGCLRKPKNGGLMLEFSFESNFEKKTNIMNWTLLCVSGVMLTCICSRSTLRSAILVTWEIERVRHGVKAQSPPPPRRETRSIQHSWCVCEWTSKVASFLTNLEHVRVEKCDEIIKWVHQP